MLKTWDETLIIIAGGDFKLWFAASLAFGWNLELN